MPLLRDVVPQDFFIEFMNTPAAKLLDIEVVEEVSRTILVNDMFDSNPNWVRWQGPARNVHCWWKLADGRCVGWNENPATGWSFPVYGRKNKAA